MVIGVVSKCMYDKCPTVGMNITLRRMYGMTNKINAVLLFFVLIQYQNELLRHKFLVIHFYKTTLHENQ